MGNQELNNDHHLRGFSRPLFFLHAMFEPFKFLLANITDLELNGIILEVWEQEDVQEIIIGLNTRNQLFDEGIDSEGQTLGEYTPFTKGRKQEKGLPFDRITLYDTGEFYDSFYIKPVNDGFEIIADPVKDDTDLFTDYGKEILGLTSESKDILIKTLLVRLQAHVKNRLFT